MDGAGNADNFGGAAPVAGPVRTLVSASEATKGRSYGTSLSGMGPGGE
jgi:hypothetical protein